MKRRTFLNQVSAISAGAVAMSALPKSLHALARQFSGDKTINVAGIGLNSMGWFDLSTLIKHPNVTCVALCDVDHNVLNKRVEELAKQGIKVKAYTDYRQLLANKTIDAVVIGTPDHWHCKIMVDACKAGKDVYVEKPAGNSIVECRAMVAAAKKYNRVVQVGQWQRSQKHFADAVDFVQSGKLGKIRLVKAWAYIGFESSIPKKPDGPAPEGVDYKQWLGPATMRPFNPNRFHFNFRWFWDYGGGQMTDWGVHLIDYAVLGMNAGMPKSIVASGGKFAYPDDAAETPDTMTALYEYEDYNIQWEHATGISGGPYGRDHGIAYIGNNGTLVLNRGGWEVIPENKFGKLSMDAVPLQKSEDEGLVLHTKNFLDVVRSRKTGELKAPIEVGAHIATIAQMGNIAYKVGEKLYWDNAKGKFSNPAANHYLAAGYHNGYELPHV